MCVVYSQCVSIDTVYTARIEDATKGLVCGWLRVSMYGINVVCNDRFGSGSVSGAWLQLIEDRFNVGVP